MMYIQKNSKVLLSERREKNIKYLISIVFTIAKKNIKRSFLLFEFHFHQKKNLVKERCLISQEISSKSTKSIILE